MRTSIILAGVFLAGCSGFIEPKASDPMPSARYVGETQSPKTADLALRPFYDNLEIDLPRAFSGPPLPTSDTVLTRITFGSCQAGWKPIPALDQIAQEKSDLFIYLGDNVYGDERTGNALLPNLRQQYADLGALPEFKRLRAQTPMMTTWDDHDYGLNDAGGDFAFKYYAKQIFLEFWNEPEDSIRRQRDGLYDAKIFGVDGQKVQIIMLDTRFFRSSPLVPTDERGVKGKERYLSSHDPKMTILGNEQWNWFEAELQKPADIRLIITSIQVLADDHGWEAWDKIEPERQKFFQTVRNSGAKGVVIISGDRHISAFYEKKDALDYSLFEFTSSALNMSFTDRTPEYDRYQLSEAVAINNYGMLDINWEGRLLTLHIKDVKGEVQRELLIPFAKIGL